MKIPTRKWLGRDPAPSSFQQQWLLPVCVMLLVLGGVLWLDRNTQEHLVWEHRSLVLQQLGLIRARLESGINTRLFLGRGLLAYIQLHPDISNDEFQELAQKLVDTQQTGIRSIHLTKRGIVSHIYPLAGNEAAIGVNLLLHPQQRQAAWRAIEAQRTILDGPVALIQGGSAFVSHTPIFLDTPTGKTLWGLASIILDSETLLREAGMLEHNTDLLFAIRGKTNREDNSGQAIKAEGLDNTGAIFLGNAAIFTMNPEILPLYLPDGSWEIAALPVQGWTPMSTESYPQWWWRIGGIILALLSGLITAILLHTPRRLREAVAVATRELRETNHKLFAEISERKRAESSLQKAQEELEAKVQERTLALTITNEQLHQVILDHQETGKQLRLFSLAIEQSPVTVVITNARGMIQYVNPQFCVISGYSREDVKGYTPGVLKSGMTPTETYQDLWQTIMAHQTWHGEFINRKKNGELYWEMAHISPIIDSSGEITHFVAIKEDVTRRKQAERELQEAKERAEEANRAKSDFLSRMSHELRTPLNAILGFCQVLSSDPLDPLTEEQSASLAFITQAGEHLLALINDILDLSKIEAGRVVLEPEEIAARALLDESIHFVQPTAEWTGIQILDQTATQSLPILRVDYRRAKQIMLNLLSNAIKYNREGGTVTVAAEARQEGMLQIRISDSGYGIPLGKQNDLFKPFYRLGAESSAIEGTGIGLTITKQLVELMGGTIGFSSQAGKGSTFWVELPLSADQEQEEHGEGIRNSPMEEAKEITQQQTILYVEDNAANLNLVTKILARLPRLTVLSAPTAEEGLVLANQHHPDLILMDINLPGMDGFAALTQLRNTPATRTIPVIAISANAMPQTIARGHEAGFNGYLTKPINIQKFLETVQNTLAQSPLVN